jgi:hypothetical protein
MFNNPVLALLLGFCVVQQTLIMKGRDFMVILLKYLYCEDNDMIYELGDHGLYSPQ